jgi:tripartite-type tricarboxylate transporter receptor subunit TctC
MTTRRQSLLAALALGISPGRVPAARPGEYPTKPLRILVGSSPGGLTDAYARLFGELYTARFGLPCVVENRAGASGIIALETMLKAPPDGYTIACTTTGMVWQLRVLARKLPFDLEKDIAPITVFPSGPLILAVQESSGVRDLKDLIEWARKRPCTMGSYSLGSYPHVLAESLNRDFATRIQAIQYKGEGPMWVDMGSGATDMAVGSYLALTGVRDKGLRAIAATGPLRCPKLAQIPTLAEQGLKAPVALLQGGLALTAHSAVPEAVLEMLSATAVQGNDSTRARGLRDTFAIPDVTRGRQEAQRLWREDATTWIREVQALNLSIDG